MSVENNALSEPRISAAFSIFVMLTWVFWYPRVIMFYSVPSEPNYLLLNDDGDFCEQDDSRYWWIWCSDDVDYEYDFSDNGTLYAETWSKSSERKYRLATMKQYNDHGLPSFISLDGKKVNIEFGVTILNINVSHSEEFLRLSLVVCVHLDGGKMELYMEYDFYQSPNCRREICEGGNFRYCVIGDQTVDDGWVYYRIDFTDTFIAKWGKHIYDMGNLQAVIFTIELENARAALCADDVRLFVYENVP